jgi:hypothetical protein
MNSFKRIALRASLVALLAAAIGMCLPMNALADDIAGTFSGTANPNGAWSYGQFTELTSTFTPLAFHNDTSSCSNLPNWSGAPGGFPVVVGNNSGSSVTCGSWTLPTDTLNLHPTNTSGLDSDVRWTAPAAGTYLISGSYSALDTTTTLDSILLNGASLFSTNINSLNLSKSFSLTETLAAGGTIDFTVNCCSGLDQNFNNDSTGLQGSITLNSAPTPAPEPSALFLALGGMALLLPLSRHRPL